MSDDPSRYAGVRVLMVEDMAVVRAIVRRMLEDIGVGRVFEADDGASGLEALQVVEPDLIICDIGMKPMDGFEFVERVRAAGGRRQGIIFLTARAEPELVARARKLGIDCFLVKPVKRAELAQRIDTVLGRRGA